MLCCCIYSTRGNSAFSRFTLSLTLPLPEVTMGELASYKYSETGPNFLFPSLAKLLSPAAAVNRFIKDISPSSTHGVYGPYRVPSLPRDAVGQSIRVGAVTDAFMGNLFPHFIAQGTGHSIKGAIRELGAYWYNKQLIFNVPFAKCMAGWPSALHGTQNFYKTPVPASLEPICALGVSIAQLDKLADSLFWLSAFSAPQLLAGGSLRAFTHAMLATNIMNYEAKWKQGHAVDATKRLISLVQEEICPCGSDPHALIVKWGDAVRESFSLANHPLVQTEDTILLSAPPTSAITQLTASFQSFSKEVCQQLAQVTREVSRLEGFVSLQRQPSPPRASVAGSVAIEAASASSLSVSTAPAANPSHESVNSDARRGASAGLTLRHLRCTLGAETIKVSSLSGKTVHDTLRPALRGILQCERSQDSSRVAVMTAVVHQVTTLAERNRILSLDDNDPQYLALLAAIEDRVRERFEQAFKGLGDGADPRTIPKALKKSPGPATFHMSVNSISDFLTALKGADGSVNWKEMFTLRRWQSGQAAAMTLAAAPCASAGAASSAAEATVAEHNAHHLLGGGDSALQGGAASEPTGGTVNVKANQSRSNPRKRLRGG